MRAEAYVVPLGAQWAVRLTLFPPGRERIELVQAFKSRDAAALKVAEIARSLELDNPNEKPRRSTA